jgi:hypothetical protein
LGGAPELQNCLVLSIFMLEKQSNIYMCIYIYIRAPELLGSKHIHALGIIPELQKCLLLNIFALWGTSRIPELFGSKHLHALGGQKHCGIAYITV